MSPGLGACRWMGLGASSGCGSSTPAKRAEVFGLNETLCRFEASNGDVGYGMHENFIVGIYRPYGFDAPNTMAP